MPLYVFRCEECGRVREYLIRLDNVDDTIVDCPEGCAVPMRRTVTAGSFQLKGQGFHQNDYDKTGSKEK